LLGTIVGIGQEGNFLVEITDHINEFGLDLHLQKAYVVKTQGSSVNGRTGDALVESVIRSGDELFESGEDGKRVGLR